MPADCRRSGFLLLVREIFRPDFGMFTCDDDSRYVWFNPVSYESTSEYRLIGTLMGLAIYNGIILDLHFPPVCYKKLMGIAPSLADLSVSMPMLARGLQQLIDFDGDVEETFCRDFVVSLEQYGQVTQYPLKPGGDKIAVTAKNRQEYVSLYVEFILTRSIERQFAAFKDGFFSVCGGNAFSLFSAEEVERMVCGSTELDLNELSKVTEYEGFTRDNPTIKNFWEVVNAFPVEMKKKLLVFATGSDRVPVGGMAAMKFKITKAGPDSERLPVAHTCFNQICLCAYRTKEKLEDKLVVAITGSEGFGLK
eukprot:Opistho-2@42609